MSTPPGGSPDPFAALARSRGPLAAGWFRVLVHEADGRTSWKDFAQREEAVRYADDAASEVEDGHVSSQVFDSEFCPVHAGRHYAARG